MPKSKKKRDPIPASFNTLAEAGDFWGSHSLADYWDQTREVHFHVDLRRRVFLTALEPGLAEKLATRARQEGVSTETLINLWLAERLAAPPKTC
jgi:hypothetical protein